MKKRCILILLLTAAAFVFFSCEEDTQPAVIAAAWDDPNRVKLTIEGDWSSKKVSDFTVVIYGNTTDTYYLIDKVLDNPLMVTGRAYDIRAEINPAWKSNDRISVYGWNDVLGGCEFTTPK